MQYVQGIFTLANVFIAFFIVLYASLFLKKTQRHRERRPWEFLFLASVLFMVFEVISILSFFGIIFIGGVDFLMIGKFFEFLYSGSVLLAFVSQHDLILRSHLILISKKDAEEKK